MVVVWWLSLAARKGQQPQRPGDLPGVSILCEHLRGLQPHFLPAGPALPVSPPPSGYPMAPV